MSVAPGDRGTSAAVLTVHVPFRLARRGGRKAMLLPSDMPQPQKADNTLIKALARAFRWRRMLEEGEVATIADLASREKIAPSYLTRLPRLTFLAPDIVDAILDGSQDPSLTAEALRGGIPDAWDMQRAMCGLDALDAGAGRG